MPICECEWNSESKNISAIATLTITTTITYNKIPYNTLFVYVGELFVG